MRGMSLPALALAIATMAILTIGVARQKLTSGLTHSGSALGYSINQVSMAVDNYRGTNLITLTSSTPSVAGFANALAPTVPELIAQNYLTPNVLAAPPGGNGYTISINKAPPGCVGPSSTCNVWSQITLINPLVEADGSALSNDRLSAIVAAIQEPASFSQRPDPTTITGGGGAWTVSNPDPAKRVGILTVVAGLGGTGTMWTHPGDPRDPAFTGNLTVAGYMKPSAGPSQTAVAGTACTEPTGAIRNDTQGRLLTCQGGIWSAPDGGKSQVLQAPVNNVPGGTNFPVATCAPGGTPWASYAAQGLGVNDTVTPPVQTVSYSVSKVGSTWVTLTQAATPSASAMTVNGNSAILGFIPYGVFSSGCSYS